MNESKKNIAIGFFVLAGICLVVWLLLFLHPSLGDGGLRMSVRFPNIDKVAVGTRVTFAGKPVGEVIAIRLVPEARANENENQNSSIFAYEVALAIDSHVKVYSSDEISIKTSGLMGERTIAITPRYSKTATPIGNNELIYAAASDSVEDTFAGINNLAKKMEKTIDDVNQMQADLQKTLLAIENTAQQLQILTKRANDLDIVGSASTLLLSTQNQIDHIGTHFNQILSKVSSGEGSFAKIVLNDDFYMKSLAILNKVDILMNDFNNYGALFHLDKGWQRDRRKRMEQLAQLRSPSAFTFFLNDEMQKIALSVNRVNMAITKAEGELTNPKTKQEFASGCKELITQLQLLEQNVTAASNEFIEDSTNVPNTTLEKTAEN